MCHVQGGSPLCGGVRPAAGLPAGPRRNWHRFQGGPLCSLVSDAGHFSPGTPQPSETPALALPRATPSTRDSPPRAVSMATWHPGGAGPANWGIWTSLGTWQCRGGWRKEDPAPQEAEKHLEGKGGLDLRRPCPAPPATLHLSSVSEARRWPVTGHPSPRGAGGLPVGFGVGGSRSGMQNAWGGPWQEGGQSATPSRS